MTDVTGLDLTGLSGLLETRQLSSLELIDACHRRIERVDPALNAFRDLDIERARADAKASDARKHRLGPLDGVPFAAKENIDIEGLVTRSGLGPRRERAALRDADIIRRMRRAGAIVLGHTAMHEGALGATNDNPHYGRTHNPWCLGHTPGGSSGGSAAAVAAGLCPLALGTDTMGSVRLPAAYCGLAGYKPSRALIDEAGIEPLCPPLDHVGALARSVNDLRLWIDAVTEARIETSQFAPRSLRWACLYDVDDLDLTGDVQKIFDDVQHTLARSGIAISKHARLDIDPGKARRAGLLLAEAAAADHFREDRERYPTAFSKSFERLLDYGAKADDMALVEAKARVGEVERRINQAFSDVDLIITPTTPQTAFSFDQPPPSNQADLTAPANFAGLPAITLPVALSDKGFPVGLQVMAARDADSLVLAAAAMIEDVFAFDLPELPHGDWT